MKNCIRYFSRQHCSLICIISLFATPLCSEVTLDGSIGPAQNLSGPDYQIEENLGQRTGGNLFHSFGRFNLGKTESATFNGSPDIQNVISRVTGGQTSTIDGLLKSTIP
ncbi:MAG: filamentous hemagglutinin N-terminal domain-containing protein, partial [Methylococcales bacterium]|nr:filamentous hemagglutinin N-terminal domain-containing protein [Methylococcales bacterium]